MRRNLGSEVLIAVGGLGIIICGLVFAILLSGSTEGDNSTPVAESNTNDVTVTDTVESTVTDSPTDTPEPTATGNPTDTVEPTATDNPTDTVEPTATVSPTDTSEPIATETDNPTETLEPTVTDEPETIATKAPTDSPMDTPEPTVTDNPTDTPEPTATSDVNESAQTSTPVVSGFTGIIPTLPPSPTVTSPDEPTRTPASCRLPRGWTQYLVQPGDTLFAISLVTNSTVDELRFANCIDNIDNITAGDIVFVPVAPIRPVSTLVPSGVRAGLASVGCTSLSTQITNLVAGQRVSGIFTVIGTATRPDFQYYKIEVRPDFADIYNFYLDSQSQVVNGTLGDINADIFGPGLHWIRLSVVDLRATIPPDGICEIPVIFE